MKQPIIIQINKPIQDLHAIEHDINTRFPIFQFRDGIEKIDLSNSRVRVYGINNNLNNFFSDLEIVNAKEGIAKLELTDTMLVEGKTQMQFVIMPNAGGQLKSQIFNLINGKSLVNSEAIEGSNEYKTFEEALKTLGNYDSRLTKVENNLQSFSSRYDTRFSVIENTLNSNTQDIAKADDKISNNENKINDIKNRIDFDISKLNPEYYTHLSPAKKQVLQNLCVDEETGEMYVTQMIEKSTGYETYYISRLDKNGKLIDGLEVAKGGHGTAFSIERSGGKVYIWSSFDIASPEGAQIGNAMTRFPYSAGSININSPTVERFPKWDTTYRRPAVDAKNDKIAFYINKSGQQVVELRKLSEVKAQVDNVLYEVVIPSDLSYFQGMCIDDTDLYWRTGDTNAATSKDEITVIDFKTGRVTKRVVNTFGESLDGNFEGNFREPEGIYITRDKLNGKKTVYAPIVTGYEGQRIYKVYCFNELGNGNKLTSEKLSQVQPYPLTDNEGKCLFLPKVSKISDINKPGTYYMTTIEAGKFSDHPGVEDAGWLLEVTPQSDNRMFKQTLTKNSVTYKEYRRICRTTGETSNWKLFQ